MEGDWLVLVEGGAAEGGAAEVLSGWEALEWALADPMRSRDPDRVARLHFRTRNFNLETAMTTRAALLNLVKPLPCFDG